MALNPTDVLRAGTYPVQRISSSGAAITALLADTGATEVINFVFSASEPTAAQQTHGGQQRLGLPARRRDRDGLGPDRRRQHAPTPRPGCRLPSCSPSTPAPYTKWNQLPGNSGGSSDTIVPLIPPSGSSIYKTFIADLKTANGGTAPTLSASVKTVEQNDPTAITGDVELGRRHRAVLGGSADLWNAGYFHNPATAFPGSGTALDPGVKLLDRHAAGDGTRLHQPDHGLRHLPPERRHVDDAVRAGRHAELGADAVLQPRCADHAFVASRPAQA